MAACFIFLAAKVEEQPRKLEHVLKYSHLCLHGKDKLPPDPKSDVSVTNNTTDYKSSLTKLCFSSLKKSQGKD